MLKFGKMKKAAKENTIDAVLQDAKQCLNSGHPDDAIAILDTALKDSGHSPDTMMGLYEALISAYSQQENESLANTVRRDMVDYVLANAPHLKERILPSILDLHSAGQFTPSADEVYPLAQAALQRQDFPTVTRLIGRFAQDNPSHPDLVGIYLVMGKALMGQKDTEKAYRLLGGLMKKYPDSPMTIEVKSTFLEAKRQLQMQKKNS